MNTRIITKDPILTEKEVEKVYPVSRRTLQNWRFQKKGPAYYKVGGNIYYRQNDLEFFFSQGRIEPSGR